jgi:hypothetical protein
MKKSSIEDKKKEKYEILVQLTNQVSKNYKNADMVEENLNSLRIIIECFIWADQQKQSFITVVLIRSLSNSIFWDCLFNF